MFIARTGHNSLCLVKNGAFSPAEIVDLLEATRSRGATPVLVPGMDPDALDAPLFASVLDANRRAAMLEDHPYRVDPVTDDRPFFFENARLSNVFDTEGDWIHGRVSGQAILAVTLVALLLLSIPLFVLGAIPGALPRASSSGGGLLTRLLTSLPFLLFGFAYLFVEIAMMQRLSLPLGHPVLAVAVVLVSMLVGSGIGSLCVGRVRPRGLAFAPLAAAVCVHLACVFFAEELSGMLADASITGRIAVVCAFLALPSFAMGLPFPSAIRLLQQTRPGLVPSAWVANGVGSAIGGPTAVMISMEAGFGATINAGIGAYVSAGLCLLILYKRRGNKSS